jgi:GC-rich sequence DNA-binding factor
LSTLTTSHSTTTETLAILAAESQSLEEKETGLRKMVGEADAKKSWFEEMTSKTEDLGAFLDVKVTCLFLL